MVFTFVIFYWLKTNLCPNFRYHLNTLPINSNLNNKLSWSKHQSIFFFIQKIEKQTNKKKQIHDHLSRKKFCKVESASCTHNYWHVTYIWVQAITCTSPLPQLNILKSVLQHEWHHKKTVSEDVQPVTTSISLQVCATGVLVIARLLWIYECLMETVKRLLTRIHGCAGWLQSFLATQLKRCISFWYGSN